MEVEAKLNVSSLSMPAAELENMRSLATLEPTDQQQMGNDTSVGAMLRSADMFTLVVSIVWLSHAWIYPSLNTSDTPPGLSQFNILSNGVFLYGTLRLFFMRQAAAVLHQKLLVCIIAIGTIGLLWSTSVSNTFGMIRLEVLFLGVCLFIRCRFNDTTIIATFIDVIGLILLFSIFAALFTPLGVMRGFDAGRWRGLFGHKNSLGEYSSLALLVLFAAWRGGLPMSMRHLVYGASACLCLLMAGSATSIGVLAFMLGIFQLTRMFANSRLQQGLNFVAFIVLILSFAFAAYTAIPIITELLGRDLTFTGRADIWKWFLFFGDQRPWTGWGWATITANEGMLGYIRQVLGLPAIQTPHNAYISIIVELGYPALLIYIVWLFNVFLDSSRRAMYLRTNIDIMRVALVSGLALHNFFESTAGVIPSLWLLLIITTGKGQIHSEKRMPT